MKKYIINDVNLELIAERLDRDGHIDLAKYLYSLRPIEPLSKRDISEVLGAACCLEWSTPAVSDYKIARAIERHIIGETE